MTASNGHLQLDNLKLTNLLSSTALRQYEEFLQEEEQKRQKPQYISLRDAWDLPDIETKYIIENMLPAQGTSMFVSKPKIGKSTLVKQMARCVASGTSFLGRATTESSVLYVALEDTLGEIVKDLKMGHATRELPIFIHSVSHHDIPEDRMKFLEDMLEEIKPGLVVIDTMGRWFAGQRVDYNSFGEMNFLLGPFEKLSMIHSTHIMFTHHDNKGGGSVSVIDRGNGSVAIPAAVDTKMDFWEAEPGSTERIFTTTQKKGGHYSQTILNFNKDTLTYSVTGNAVQVAKQRLEQEILSLVVAGPKNRTEIRTATRRNDRTIKKALDTLVNRGYCTVSGAGAKGNAQIYTYSGVCEEYDEYAHHAPHNLPLPAAED